MHEWLLLSEKYSVDHLPRWCQEIQLLIVWSVAVLTLASSGRPVLLNVGYTAWTHNLKRDVWHAVLGCTDIHATATFPVVTTTTTKESRAWPVATTLGLVVNYVELV